ncbi:hypothetical protein [Nocardia alba]|uniref:Uncharacterized protein n=1 Tax=Nocardia alba TaxID=225051 RepID=A0A4R1FIF3_9NOCA|nr:hypothetical protein [Nocardia alba]TCJ94616.1 hypothetical protein DFR71_5219 [Nocardia alba]
MITTATCSACTAPSTTVLPEHTPGPWAPDLACQDCYDAYIETRALMADTY